MTKTSKKMVRPDPASHDAFAIRYLGSRETNNIAKTYVTSRVSVHQLPIYTKMEGTGKDVLPEMEKKNIANDSPAHLVLLRQPDFSLITFTSRVKIPGEVICLKLTNYVRSEGPDSLNTGRHWSSPEPDFSIPIPPLLLF